MNARPVRPTSRDIFLLGWSFLAAAAALGLLLRLAMLWNIPGVNPGFMIHSHSHTAFHGWIYNAFFALALHWFVPAGAVSSFRPLFLITQIGIVGMMVTFPFQGYARESIIFSTLHLVCSAVFGWKLWRDHTANPAARTALRWAFGFMFLSAAGPLALGVLAAAGLRGTEWYAFSIYFYLHFQTNGWFIFFLLALLIQRSGVSGHAAIVLVPPLRWMAAGCILTTVLSALWMSPPPWLRALGLAGGVLQLYGFALLATRMRSSHREFAGAGANTLARVGAAAFALKLFLQCLAALPGLAGLVTARMVVIGFLHLVFLGAITPLLMAFAAELRWLRFRAAAATGATLFAAGAIVTELVLFAFPLALLLQWGAAGETVIHVLAGCAAVMAFGVVLVLAGNLRRHPSDAHAGQVLP